MIVAALVGCRGPEAVRPASEPTIAERFGDRPFLTPIDAPPTVALVAGGEIPTTAATCGACHPDHYAEWSGATHAAASQDLQFLGELAKAGQPRWLCLNCHLPTRPQRVDRVAADSRFAHLGGIDALVRQPEPEFDPARVAEGVSCATCHVRRDDDGLGVVVGPRGSGRAPHRVRVDPAGLDGICEQCHSPGDAALTPTFVCWFQSRDEVEAGPSAGASCPTCHMPQTDRAAAVGGPPVTLRRHLWLGGGVPKTVDGYDRLLADGFDSGLDIAVRADPLEVSISNARSGHLVPTADPERYLRVEVRAEDAGGTRLARDVLRIGQTWDWGDDATGRPATRLTDDRLKPGETRRWTPTVDRTGADHLVVEVMAVRLSPANARYLEAAVLDDELLALRPDAGPLLASVDQRYPLASYLWRGVVSADGAVTVTAPDELIAASKALVGRSLAEKDDLLTAR